MFEKTVSGASIKVIKGISEHLDDFYLAGGTGLALQLGHRKSDDFDFFTQKEFSPKELIHKIKPNAILQEEWGTLHCNLATEHLTFLFYEVPLKYPTVSWNGINIADYRDIASEKIRTISERGAKKDFYDVYALLKMKLSIEELTTLLKSRFAETKLSYYAVLKSLIYFVDAENTPNPTLLMKGKEWKWECVKKYFVKNVKGFERHLIKPS